MSAKPDNVIGLDPGSSTGLALWCRASRRLLEVHTLTFWKAYDFVRDRFTPETAEIVVEVPNTRGALYSRTSAQVADGRGRDKFAANVGSVRREAVLLAERFEQLGFAVRRVTPRGKKWDAEQMRRYTGYEGRTSEHGRDAARLVVGL